MKITFDALCSLVNDVRDDERDREVHFGCDCGCGGDSYTYEEWTKMCRVSDDARVSLEVMGVTFPDAE